MTSIFDPVALVRANGDVDRRAASMRLLKRRPVRDRRSCLAR